MFINAVFNRLHFFDLQIQLQTNIIINKSSQEFVNIFLY
ncbi:uncharacterized protein METZ01_LOCUS131669 [marine metagenome]|uniref:Uncharacterized protein n=1 Tax=marine metagenome TaxID=408172 RepID=A0A381YP92_9ZZZZ